MNKYVIVWNAGFGDEAEVVEANSEEEAEKLAYEAWRQDAENSAEYSAREYTKELAQELDLEE